MSILERASLDAISCIIRAETGCSYAVGDKAAQGVLDYIEPIRLRRKRDAAAARGDHGEALVLNDQVVLLKAQPFKPSLDGRGYYEEDAPGYEEAS